MRQNNAILRLVNIWSEFPVILSSMNCNLEYFTDTLRLMRALAVASSGMHYSTDGTQRRQRY